MMARLFALAFAFAAPVVALAQEAAAPGAGAQQLAAAIAAEGCSISQANSDAVQARLTGMNDEGVMAATVELIIGGYLVEEPGEVFRLKGLGC